MTQCFPKWERWIALSAQSQMWKVAFFTLFSFFSPCSLATKSNGQNALFHSMFECFSENWMALFAQCYGWNGCVYTIHFRISICIFVHRNAFYRLYFANYYIFGHQHTHTHTQSVLCSVEGEQHHTIGDSTARAGSWWNEVEMKWKMRMTKSYRFLFVVISPSFHRAIPFFPFSDSAYDFNWLLCVRDVRWVSANAYEYWVESFRNFQRKMNRNIK